MPTILIFGLGYSASAIAGHLRARGWRIEATGSAGTLDFPDREAVRAALGRASHVLSSVPPAAAAPDAALADAMLADAMLAGSCDPVLARYGAALAAARSRGVWLGYLSSTGVYGNTGGAWADESAPVVGQGGSGRRGARSQADASWLALGARVFRLPGIYGPGRSALDRLRARSAHRVDLPGQVFSRVHVEDIAAGVIAAIERSAAPGAWNLADDEPSHQNAVIEQACRLLRTAPPPLLGMAAAGLSPQTRAFYAENRRVANGKAKRLLGWSPRFPSYREGLAAILDAETRPRAGPPDSAISSPSSASADPATASPVQR